jgi:hypothetical protein
MPLGEKVAKRVDDWLTEAIKRAERDAHFLRPDPRLKGNTTARHEAACQGVEELRRVRDEWRAGRGITGKQSAAVVVECSQCDAVPDYDGEHARCRTTTCQHFGRPVPRADWNEKHWPAGDEGKVTK